MGERDARVRLIKALENKPSSNRLDNRIVLVISKSTGVSVARLWEMEKELMDEDAENRR